MLPLSPTLLALLAAATSAASDQRALSAGCLLFTRQPDAPAEQCMSCHAGGGASTTLHSTHPVDLDYEAARLRGGFSAPLRPADEVRRQGVSLPDGRLRCSTCHASSSDWNHHLALPPNSHPRPAVHLRDPTTWGGTPGRMGAAAQALEAEARRTKDATPTPLCKVCHAFD
ncbi:hypothetical protein [Anaeromyxobacter paludicola]|uniref:Cytochrome c family protein n=1 Tax=Anaeromyxobacter paludicola TaxID=2918171 RepID=A0ABM7XBM1_9BACT|nr:hypothetical protein [Anaeromyxobacter paludicola]BDG09238.1 hypothetical protein AMPC_23510 [Anaeromyxobacter paludicola]